MKTDAPTQSQKSPSSSARQKPAEPKHESASRQADAAAKRGEPRQPDNRSDRSPKQENL